MMGGNDLIRRLILFFKGYVKIYVYGAKCTRFFNLCANHGIEIWELHPLQNGYECYIVLKDVYRLKSLARKCHIRFRVIEKIGLPFYLNRHRKRKVFVLGICCCGFLIFWLSVHIWNIEISGNLRVSRAGFLEYLKEYGVYYGTPRKMVDCKQMAADIRNEFSEFTWVSVKQQGTGLHIEVQENTDIELYENREYPDSDLISNVSGEIVKMVTRNGTPQVKVGDRIEEGQILVLGRTNITDDSGTVVKYQYCASDADIYVKTSQEYQDEFFLQYEKNVYTGRHRKGAYVKIGNMTFGCCPFLNQLNMYENISQNKQLSLWQDFYLPVSITTMTAREYQLETAKYTEDEAISIAEAKLHKFLSEKEEKGVQIFEKNVRIHLSGSSCLSTGTITFIEKAGIRKNTEYLKLQQENDDS